VLVEDVESRLKDVLYQKKEQINVEIVNKAKKYHAKI